MGAGVTQRITVALAGNPNVGKSTLFNALTGMRQHTGNWPGKTVGIGRGVCRRGDVEYVFYDLPGTYSLSGETEDECVAADFLEKGSVDCTVVVCDGSALERSLILALQILSRGEKAVLCVNLMDEAHRRGHYVSRQTLEAALSVPVVLMAAGRNEGTGELLIAVAQTVMTEKTQVRPQFPDPVTAAGEIAAKAVTCGEDPGRSIREQVEKLLVSRRFGIPLLFIVMTGIIWLTVWGANYPSAALERLFNYGYDILQRLLVGTPAWLRGITVDGMYLTAARVIAVMLPPMAIFFPLFTFLEDVGYLPRMAFLMDRSMARCKGCGKQALTMCMGLGCNAVGVMGCRIIGSPKGYLAAVLTNAMVPCNGRFPGLIVFASLAFSPAVAPLAVAFAVLFGVLGAMAATGALQRIWKGGNDGFFMELPPFRKPRIGQILVRSLLERTLFVAGRALTVAVPAGAVLWLFANTGYLSRAAALLEPAGDFLGMCGPLILAFLFALPANELTVPVLLMTLTGAGSLQAVEGLGIHGLKEAISPAMALCAMVFTVFHWPCTTTLLIIQRETGSIKKTAAAFFLPTAVGCILCLLLRLLL